MKVFTMIAPFIAAAAALPSQDASVKRQGGVSLAQSTAEISADFADFFRLSTQGVLDIQNLGTNRGAIAASLETMQADISVALQNQNNW